MKYFLDTEFIEGTQKSIFNTKPTIDLISIGIVSEDGREYYAISKDFNLKEAWNRYDEKPNMDYKPSFGGGSDGHYNPQFIKEYWLRDNVLKPIFKELCVKDELSLFNNCKEIPKSNLKVGEIINSNYYDFILLKQFTYKNFKKLINKYGKTNKQIAEEVINFCAAEKTIWETDGLRQLAINRLMDNPVEFYGYYSDYDWVVFCWLFGKMIDLPKGFPMYCIDLKQTLDDKVNSEIKYLERQGTYKLFNAVLNDFEKSNRYPKQTNEHNALANARFNYQLYKFLNTL